MSQISHRKLNISIWVPSIYVNPPKDLLLKSKHDGKKSFKCNSCDFYFATIRYLKHHIASVHDEKKPSDDKKKPFTCSICGVGFSSNHNLKQHIASIHEQKKPFKCDSWAILKHPGSSRFGKEGPGYLGRYLQVIFSKHFFLKSCKEDPKYLR